MAIGDRTSRLDRPAVPVTIASPSAGEPMLIDRLMLAYDAVRAEHRIVSGDIDHLRGDTPRRLHPRLARVRRGQRAVRRARRR
jgi:hypothetical protein